MRQPPPVPGAPLLSRDALVTTAVDAAVMAAATLGAFGLTLRRSGDSLAASTVAFSTLSAGQLLYALACRSDERSGLRGLGDNPDAGRRRRWHAGAAGRHRDRASAPRSARRPRRSAWSTSP